MLCPTHVDNKKKQVFEYFLFTRDVGVLYDQPQWSPINHSTTVLQVIYRHLCCEGKPLILHLYCSGPARLSKRRGVNYDEWLGRKVAAEQRIIDAKKAEIERKRVEEEERWVVFGITCACICIFAFLHFISDYFVFGLLLFAFNLSTVTSKNH